MERYLIALDLDGTTLNTEGQLSAGTIAVLRAAQAAGHLVVITTGRPDAISEQFYDTLHLRGPMINDDSDFGCVIVTPAQSTLYL